MRHGEVGVVCDKEAHMRDGADEVSLIRDDHTGASGRPNNGVSDLGLIGRYTLMTQASDRFVDDLIGIPLSPDICRAARKKEIDYFREKAADISGVG